ncbi:MAG: peptidoglycan DD-metalloendopeptidase family protein [Alphaproteobacteria bacterium]|nr:peptidoglycan DD-metalloendopeptidase family protein [Alphaproteobacteria bacterium]
MPSKSLPGIRTTGHKMPRLTAAHIPFLILFMTLAIWPRPADAGDKNKVKAALEAKQAAQVKLLKKSQTLEQETTALQAKLIDMSKGLRKLEDSLADGKTRLSTLQKDKSQLEHKLFAEQDTVGGLVTAAQRFSRTSTPTMMVQSDPLEAARAARLMKTLIPVLHEKSAALRAEIAALDSLEKDIAAQQDKQQRALAAINAEEDKLGKLLEERRKDLHQTEAEKTANNAEVARLAREAKNLDELVEKVEQIDRPRAKPARSDAEKTRTAGVSAAAPVGSAHSPVPGTVRTGFGETDDLGAPSKGITYNARSNARVVTPLAGTVRFAGPFHKYKHILIVEHAGGYHSLIAGLGRVDTVVGARVAAGEPVGTVDRTDSDNHPVYYELRRNGTPINPQKILVAQRKQDKI